MGGVDGSAALKAFAVTIISTCFLAQYCALLNICLDDDVSLGSCKVPDYAIAMPTTAGRSTLALGYAIIYSLITIVSFFGCFTILGRNDSCAKFYAFHFLFLWVFLHCSIGGYSSQRLRLQATMDSQMI